MRSTGRFQSCALRRSIELTVSSRNKHTNAATALAQSK